MTAQQPATVPDHRAAAPGGGRLLSRRARVFLVAALVAVVGMAFRVSWNALRDIAMAIGADPNAALLYPVVVDGLMALALVATLVLTGRDRTFALRVLAGYTAASLVLNYVHGLVPGLHGLEDGQRVALAGWAPVHWALVLLASSLPVGAIFFGSDLVARVLHHRPESAPTEAERSTTEQPEAAATAPVPGAPTPFAESTSGRAPVDSTQRQESATSVVPDPVTDSTPTKPTSRPRPKTGRVPTAARSTAPRRTFEQLLDEARALPTADQESAERIRTALRVGAGRARELRDLLAEERAELAAAVQRPALVAVDNDPEEQLAAAVGGVR